MKRWATPLLLLFGTLAGLGLLLTHSSSRGSYADALSSYRADADGTRALYLFLEAHGLPVARRSLDLAQISDKGMLVALGLEGTECDSPKDATPARPSTDPDQEEGRIPSNPGVGLFSGKLSSKECLALLEWVEDGHNLLYASEGESGLAKTLGVHFNRYEYNEDAGVPSSSDASEDLDDEETPPSQDTNSKSVPSPEDSGEMESSPPWEKLLGQDQDGQEGDVPLGTKPHSEDAPKLLLLPRERVAAGPLRVFEPGLPSPSTQNTQRVETQASGWLSTAPNDEGDATIALLVEEGHPERALALARSYGLGWIVFLATPELFTNRTLPLADNAIFTRDLFLDLAPLGQPVLFDEYHHGHRAGRTALHYAIEHGLLPTMGQLLLILVMAVLAGRRLGRREKKMTVPIRSSEDHLATMANLYRLSGHQRHAGELIAKHALDQAHAHRVLPEIDSQAKKLERELLELQKKATTKRQQDRALETLTKTATQLHLGVHEKSNQRKTE